MGELFGRRGGFAYTFGIANQNTLADDENKFSPTILFVGKVVGALMWDMEKGQIRSREELLQTLTVYSYGIGVFNFSAPDPLTAFAQARAWLHEYHDAEYPQNIETESSYYRSLHHSSASTTITLPVLAAQPNPSKGIVYITYQLPTGVELCELEIIDANGQLIEKRTATGKGLEEWNCKQCPSGIYLVRLVAEGIELGMTKVSIVK